MGVVQEGVVEGIVRDSLGLDDDVAIGLHRPIAKLGAERIDIVDILFRCGVYHQEHFDDGQINDVGRAYLSGLCRGYVDELETIRLSRLSRSSIDEIMGSLTVLDIYNMIHNDNMGIAV